MPLYYITLRFIQVVQWPKPSHFTAVIQFNFIRGEIEVALTKMYNHYT